MKTDDDNVPDQKVQFSDYDDADDADDADDFDDDVDALSSQWLWYQMSIYFTFMISQTLGLCAPYFQQNWFWVIKIIGQIPNMQTKRPIIFNLEALLLKPQSISIWAIWLNMFSGNQNLRNLDAEEIVE